MKYLVRDRIFGIGEDYWIEDERGRKAYLVDGKALRLRETFELKDPDGQVLVTIRKKMLSLRDAMQIERDDTRLATIRKKRLSLIRNHYRVELVDGTTLDVSGRILDREFTIEYEGELLAHISKQWFRVGEAYAVNIVRDDADAALLIAVAVCVIRLAERESDDHHQYG